MIIEKLKEIDNKRRGSLSYESSFCASCIITGLILLVFYIGISWLLRYIGISEWFHKKPTLLYFTYLIIGTITYIRVSYAKSNSAPIFEKFKTVNFMKIPYIISLTLINYNFWLCYLFAVLLGGLPFLPYDDMQEKTYIRLTTLAPFISAILFLGGAYFKYGLTIDNGSDFIIGIFLSFITLYALRNTIYTGLYLYDCDEESLKKNQEIIREWPISFGYIAGRFSLLFPFLSLGDVMTEHDGSNSKD